MLHQFDSRWTFDGNMDAPTFAPSLLVGPWWRMPHDWDSDTAPRNLDGTYVLSPDGVHMASAFEAQCHSFVRSGRIEFLRDCTHEFAGQTVDLPELPEWV
jgi:hypothetical protein